MDKWFRVDSNGNIMGISTMSYDDALLNLPEGQTLLPFSEDVNVLTHVWNFVSQSWTVIVPEVTEYDYSFMRRTGYSEIIGDQLGVIMDVMHAYVNGNPVSQELKNEFMFVYGQVQAIKAANPAP